MLLSSEYLALLMADRLRRPKTHQGALTKMALARPF